MGANSVGANSLDSKPPATKFTNIHLGNLCINSVNTSNRKVKKSLKQLEPISRLNMHTMNYFFVLKIPQLIKPS